MVNKKKRGSRTGKKSIGLLAVLLLVLLGIRMFTGDPVPSPGTEQELPANSTFKVRYIDVGQANAALIECDGNHMLIDGGNKRDSELIYAVLKNEKIEELDIVVATHAHEDHVGGLAAALAYAEADLILSPVASYDSDAFEDFRKYAVQAVGEITTPSVGDTYSLGSSTITVLGVNSTEDENNSSIVLKVQYGQTSFLFTGDAEREAEQVILDSNLDLAATVLLVGHHGSDTSTTYPFLRAVAPQYAVISVGEGNDYGHPTEAVLSRLRDADVELYRTDLHGDIVCLSDGKNVSFETEKTTDCDVFTQSPRPSPAADPKPETTPSECDYVRNTNSMKFHYPDCDSVQKMKEHNKSFFTGTRDELVSQGYGPCGSCKP